MQANERWWVLLFIAPVMTLLLSLNIIPLIYSVWLAFHNWTIATRLSPPFVGVENFVKLFQDSRFGNSLLNTLVFMATAVSVEFLFGLAIALALTKRSIRGTRVFRTAVTIPMMIAPIVVGYTFRLLFHPSAGPINHFLSSVGMGWVNWIGSSKVALFSVCIADIWEWTPFMALILWSGIYSQPLDIHEAAMVDGASSWKLFRYVTLPLLTPIIMVCWMLRIVDAFRTFDIVYILTGGGPGFSSEVVSLYTYKTAFSFFKMGYAAAMSFILLIIAIIVVSQFFSKFIKQR